MYSAQKTNIIAPLGLQIWTPRWGYKFNNLFYLNGLMSYAYSEDTLIEQTAISIFKDLKWETANVYQGEKFGVEDSFASFDESND